MTTAIPVPTLNAPIYSAPPKLASIVSPMAPVIAGARARGVADALEWLGMAAVLFDEQGEALHVNDAARRRLGSALRQEAGRLVAAAPELDRGLQAAIHGAICGARTRLAIPAADGNDVVVLRIESFEGAAEDPFQLLRAVAIFESAADGPFAALAHAN